MIQVNDLTKYYGPRPAIVNINFKVERGEILGFLGPNGAGKTTTMRVLTGFMPPSSGTATVAGFDVMRQSLEARKRIGYLPENVPLYTDLSPKSYLDYAAKLRGLAGKKRQQRVDEVIEICRLGDVRDRLIGKLSKGFRQRVGLAQALLHDPEVLVLDEPTVGLDPKQINDVRKLIKSLGGNHSIILSTHILPEVSMVCNRVVIINQGRVVAQDTPENLTRRLQGSEAVHVEARGPAKEIRAALQKVPNVISVQSKDPSASSICQLTVESQLGQDVRDKIAAAIVQGGWGLLEMRPMGMSLEDIFLKLTTKEEVAS
ncbi:MAG: ABC transporter ATP-binding protein [Chloroflexota bacterium]|nr:MAG: ABC transporter ATP-binding protein [Chloroflexota bacterium]